MFSVSYNYEKMLDEEIKKSKYFNFVRFCGYFFLEISFIINYIINFFLIFNNNYFVYLLCLKIENEDLRSINIGDSEDLGDLLNEDLLNEDFENEDFENEDFENEDSENVFIDETKINIDVKKIVLLIIDE